MTARIRRGLTEAAGLWRSALKELTWRRVLTAQALGLLVNMLRYLDGWGSTQHIVARTCFTTVGEKDVRNLLVAIAMVMSTSSPIAASDNTDVMEVVRHWTDAFNRGSFNTDIAPCTEDAVVIDDLRPHVWQGPGACSNWFKAFEAWASKAAVTNAVITLGATRHLDFDAGFAYLVAPVTLSYIKAGKPVDFLGIITMTLRKGESGWRVSGVAWTDQ